MHGCLQVKKKFSKKNEKNDNKSNKIISKNIEILKGGEYSIYSDVFAFGMLMWEIVTRNSRPFANLEGWTIAAAIEEGKRPIIPIDCPIQIKNLIEQCWNKEAKQRPTMQQIIEYLEKNLNKLLYQYVDNSMSQVLNQQQPKSPQQQQYEEIIPSNANDLNNNNNNNNNNANDNDNKKKTLRMKQKQNLENYLKEIGIEIEEEDEELQQVIDIFVTQRITPNVLKLANIEDLEKSFEKLQIPAALITQLLTVIKATKVCVRKRNFCFIGFFFFCLFLIYEMTKYFFLFFGSKQKQ